MRTLFCVSVCFAIVSMEEPFLSHVASHSCENRQTETNSQTPLSRRTNPQAGAGILIGHKLASLQFSALGHKRNMCQTFYAPSPLSTLSSTRLRLRGGCCCIVKLSALLLFFDFFVQLPVGWFQDHTPQRSLLSASTYFQNPVTRIVLICEAQLIASPQRVSCYLILCWLCFFKRLNIQQCQLDHSGNPPLKMLES